ncbi:hypothetical protein BH10PSE7_BH10PSE7_44750 [soil metagenome]
MAKAGPRNHDRAMPRSRHQTSANSQTPYHATPLKTRRCPIPIQKSAALIYWMPMSLRPHLARILGALILMVAIFAVPSVASAHEGHAHKASVSTTALTHSDAAGPSAAVAVFVDVQPHSDDEAPFRKCIGMCCAGAPCGGCAGLSHVEPLTLAMMPRLAALVHRNANPLSSLVPEGPRKPPRSVI